MFDTRDKVKALLDSVETVSVATCLDNKPYCRIMEIQKVENNIKIWFVAFKSSPKVEQINRSHDASVVAFNKETGRDIRLFGKLDVLSDMESKKSVWKDELSKYFKNGINDPELIVIVFQAEKLEYRDMKTGDFRPEVEDIKLNLRQHYFDHKGTKDTKSK